MTYLYYYSYNATGFIGMGTIEFEKEINKHNLWESMKIIQKNISKKNKNLRCDEIIITNFKLIK